MNHLHFLQNNNYFGAIEAGVRMEKSTFCDQYIRIYANAFSVNTILNS